MRAAIALAMALLAGCPPSHNTGECQTDADCGGEVCTRTHECLAASQIRSVKATWTIRGMAASATTCATTPDFYIQFDGSTNIDVVAYTPVPCVAGQFTIDKLPKRFNAVELGVEGNVHDIAIIDGSGMATFNLYP
jgi:hypothetical protein